MKGFLKKRWHSIPVALVSALLILVLAAGGVFAYNFLGGSVKVEVEEAITVSYQWSGGDWIVWDGTELTTTDAYPGESVVIGVKVANASSAALTINMVATVTAAPDGGWDKITVTGGPAGGVAGHSTWEGTITGTIANDAPPGDYTVRLDFDRS